ncbi:hypothetical protein [Mesorhizobium huakuii]|uniref:Uncharacterized protein n=1 Tax=Mesorhizobium huakuii TaxID=28104 RepID=A0A7G6T0U5_9HYPH|nr:hypothetical protein [Mesorhizobium huakuii]QND60377.1 hypothetical protein HB778_30395 [Mesorhizobium huakuii]
MTIKQSDAALGKINVPYPSYAGETVTVRYKYAVPLGLVLNDIIEIAPIPPNCRVTDMVLDSDDLDTGTTIAFDVGIMSGDWQSQDQARTCGAEFFAASTLAQAGGVARPTAKTAFRTVSATTARSIGIKFQAAATGLTVGEVGLTVSYHAL